MAESDRAGKGVRSPAESSERWFTWAPGGPGPTKNPSWFETFSHKLLRLVCPWPLAGLLVASGMGAITKADPSPIILYGLRPLLGGQMAFCLFALLGSGVGESARSAARSWC